MWSPEPLAKPFARLGAILAMAVLLTGCFQPLYGEHSTVGGPAVADALQGVDVKIDAPNGTVESRLSVEVRNALLFGFTGGGGGHSPTHKLDVRLSASNQSVIVDVNSGRPDMQEFALDASYALTELATGKVVLRGQTFSRVSYDIPGQQQRFARARGQRDAENRAAKVIADQIQSRLASYFVNGA